MEVLGKAEECPTGPRGGAGGVHSLTRVPLCLLRTGGPHSGPVSGEPLEEQKPMQGEGEGGRQRLGQSPGGGGGPGPSHKGRGGLPWSTPVPLSSLRTDVGD